MNCIEEKEKFIKKMDSIVERMLDELAEELRERAFEYFFETIDWKETSERL